jgi:thioredoxin 1
MKQTKQQTYSSLRLLVGTVAAIAVVLAVSLSVACCGSDAVSAPAPGSDAASAPTSGREAASAPTSASDTASASTLEPIVITEVDLDKLLSSGLPLILNFGDASLESMETLANLEKLSDEYPGAILVRSVDLAANPRAREGFPAPILPTQFFYTAEGKPIPLPLAYGPFMSSFVPVDSEEAVFTAHEGPLDEEGIRIVKEILGLE